MKSWVLGAALVAFGARLSLGQEPFKVVSVVDAQAIAGRPVQLDSQRKLLPWPMPDDTGYSYASHFLTQWSILWDQFNRQRYHYFFCCFAFDRETFEMQPNYHHVNSTAYLRAMMEGFIEHLYPYTGDPRAIAFLQDFIDYELDNGLTPENYVWGGVPYPSADPGALRYTGWGQHGNDYVEPHIAGGDGYAYLRLYEMTGNTRYLRAAIRIADQLVKNFKPGDEKNSPWPWRCYARDGKVEGKGMGAYSANVVDPIMLFDELIRLGLGDVAGYVRVRQGAADWLHKYPLKNNLWVGYFEDMPPNMVVMNQVIPLEYARYVILHPDKDPAWREVAPRLVNWVKTTPKWPKYIVHGATVTTEQGDGKNYCCNPPNQCCDSHTARLAAVEALYYAKTGDTAYKEEAFRSYNWVTYFQGMPSEGPAPWGQHWWFTDEFADGPRRLMDGLWAVPEWAPSDESHFLGSTSVITKIAYGKGSVTYSTFDAQATEVLRLDYAPESVTAGGRPLAQRAKLDGEGFTFDEKTRVLRIRHEHSRDVDIQGSGGKAPPLMVDFDTPHLPAGKILQGQYPSGVIDWGRSQWRICAPGGRLSTFGVSLAAEKATRTEFTFVHPRVFVGVDVYNSAASEATLTIRSPEIREESFTIAGGQLRRLRMKARQRNLSSRMIFEARNGADLRFDNLAYSY